MMATAEQSWSRRSVSGREMSAFLGFLPLPTTARHPPIYERHVGEPRCYGQIRAWLQKNKQYSQSRHDAEDRDLKIIDYFKGNRGFPRIVGNLPVNIEYILG